MINIIVPIIDKNKDKYLSLLSRIDGLEDINVYVGIEEKNIGQIANFEDSENIFVTTFENDSKMEGMINSLHHYIGVGATLVLRKPITIEELEKFINCRRDVATCKVERSKVKSFIFYIWQSILRFFLGIKEYEGDTSVVYLNEDISTVIGESGNLSFSSRANRWRGIEQTIIDVKGGTVKKEIDKKSVIKFSLIAIFSLLVGIIVTTVVCLTIKVSVIVGLLLICLDIICLSISLLTIIMLVFNSRIGVKHVEEANVISSDID